MSMDKGFRIGSGHLCCLTRALFIARASASQLHGLDSILPQDSLSFKACARKPARPRNLACGPGLLHLCRMEFKIKHNFQYPHCHEAKSTSFGLRNDRVETPSSPDLVELRTRAPCWTDVRSGGGRWPPVTPRRRATNALR
ncbi:hypothetical protein J3E68DRAFT_361907 [Trichoderma sp. SZMC 28012]